MVEELRVGIVCTVQDVEDYSRLNPRDMIVFENPVLMQYKRNKCIVISNDDVTKLEDGNYTMPTRLIIVKIQP